MTNTSAGLPCSAVMQISAKYCARLFCLYSSAVVILCLQANKQIMDTGDGTPHFLKSLAELPLYVPFVHHFIMYLSNFAMLTYRTQTGQKQQRVLPKGPGEKTLTIRGTDEESEKLDSFLSDQLAALSAQRVATL